MTSTSLTSDDQMAKHILFRFASEINYASPFELMHRSCNHQLINGSESLAYITYQRRPLTIQWSINCDSSSLATR